MEEMQNQVQNQEQEKPAESVTPEATQPSQNSVSEHQVPVQKSTNLLIVVVLAVIVVILALMYLWGQSTDELPPVPPAPDIAASDELDVLEEDLTVPELDTLGSELDELEADLNAELETL